MKLALFGVLAVVQLGVPISMIVGSEEILSEGTLYKFRTAPVDPYDAFRGRYVILNFEESRVELKPTHGFTKNDTAYALVTEDQTGFADIYDVVRTPPPSGDYLRVRIRWVDGAAVILQLPFDRYYMPEDLAPKAEKVVRDRSRTDTNEAYATVSIHYGNAQIKDLYIGDLPIRAYIDSDVD